MKITFLVSVGGLDFTHQAGETYDIEENEAIRYINNGIAEAKNKKEYDSILLKNEEDNIAKQKESELASNISNLEALKTKREELENELFVINEKIQEVNIILGYVDTEKSILEKYNEDKNIVDSLSVDELKLLCKELDIKFTKEDEIRVHLKTMEDLGNK